MSNFKELIDKNLQYLSNLTKEEAEFIVHILSWDTDQRCSFMFAKRIFDDEEKDDDTDITG
jgi:hypothetical protein